MNQNTIQQMESLLTTRVDPVSGNEVPPGSKPEEVRDNILARLSRGEYVLPANVVRFYGIDRIKDLHKQAEDALDTLESKATGYAEGGPVPASADVLSPENQFARTSVKQYINPDTGRTMLVTFFDGQPIFQIPEGFVEYQRPIQEPDPDPEPDVTPDVTPAPVDIVQQPLDTGDNQDDSGHDPVDTSGAADVDTPSTDLVSGNDKFDTALSNFNAGINNVGDFISDPIGGVSEAVGRAGDKLDETLADIGSFIDNPGEVVSSKASELYDRAEKAINDKLSELGITEPSVVGPGYNTQAQNLAETAASIAGLGLGAGIVGPAVAGINNSINSNAIEQAIGMDYVTPDFGPQFAPDAGLLGDLFNEAASLFGADKATSYFGAFTDAEIAANTPAVQAAKESFLADKYSNMFDMYGLNNIDIAYDSPSGYGAAWDDFESALTAADKAEIDYWEEPPGSQQFEIGGVTYDSPQAYVDALYDNYVGITGHGPGSMPEAPWSNDPINDTPYSIGSRGRDNRDLDALSAPSTASDPTDTTAGLGSYDSYDFDAVADDGPVSDNEGDGPGDGGGGSGSWEDYDFDAAADDGPVPDNEGDDGGNNDPDDNGIDDEDDPGGPGGDDSGSW